MSELGFDYFPAVLDALDAEPGPTATEEWYATWGHGISIDTSQATQPQEAPGSDPNAEYVASTTDEGREAYDDALFGALEPGEQPCGQPGELGCQLEASNALPTAEAVPEQPELVTGFSTRSRPLFPGGSPPTSGRGKRPTPRLPAWWRPVGRRVGLRPGPERLRRADRSG